MLRLCLVVGLVGISVQGLLAAEPKQLHVYVGTYAKADDVGIPHLLLDVATGKLTVATGGKGVANPSFVAIRPDKKFLYSVSEVADVNGKKGGAVAAFAIDPSTGDLKFLNQQSTGGPGTCHVSVDKTGKAVMATNYSGGNVASFAVKDNGELAEATSNIQHTGPSGVVKNRQSGNYAHSINVSPDNRLAFACDLGADKIFIYNLDPATAKLTPHDPASVAVAPGAGPRHFTFHPNGKFAYVINELASTITAFAYDAAKGTLTDVQTISTLAEPVKGNSTAEVQVHPSGKFVYGSNRGHNSIAIFQCDPATGKLTASGHQGSGIKTPRNFGIDPTGKWLLVASQDGNDVQVFRINTANGDLEPTGEKVSIPKPVCVKFLELP